VSAISKYDTLQLYRLIDTSRFFNIYSKEGFLNKVDYVYKRLKKCGTYISYSTIKIEKEEPYHTKYTIQFCFIKEQNMNDSFSLIFSFADYRKDGVIDFMDIIVRREIKNTISLPTDN
jgi:hypothetical protein